MKEGKAENYFNEYANKEFFEKNFVGIKCTIEQYRVLKEFYQSRNNINECKDFQKSFSQFYGIGRFSSPDFREVYYNLMQEAKESQNNNGKALTEEDIVNRCIDPKGKKVQFSFATKLLNIMDDEKYPIYDSNVAAVFGFTIEAKDREQRIEKYMDAYESIKNTCKRLIVSNGNTIAEFREVFKYTKDQLSDMRILDIIIWKIGEKLIAKKNKKRESTLEKRMASQGSLDESPRGVSKNVKKRIKQDGSENEDKE